MFGFMKKLTKLLPKEATLPGRKERVHVPERHFVNGNRIVAPFPDGMALAQFGMGCFWGAEKLFWQTPGVYSTAVGYAGGDTPNPTDEETCSGRTGHAEVGLVVFDPAKVTYEQLLKEFWEDHDPTQGMRQGNDVGTQYRSALYYVNDEQRETIERSRAKFQEALSAKRFGEIATEVAPLGEYFYAEPYHQQYLDKNPGGYCPLHATGVKCG